MDIRNSVGSHVHASATLWIANRYLRPGSCALSLRLPLRFRSPHDRPIDKVLPNSPCSRSQLCIGSEGIFTAATACVDSLCVEEI